MSKEICAYCGKGKSRPGWHTCEQAQASLKKINEIIEGIHVEIRKPGWTPQTNEQMKMRADRRGSMATGAKSMGIPINPDYL